MVALKFVTLVLDSCLHDLMRQYNVKLMLSEESMIHTGSTYRILHISIVPSCRTLPKSTKKRLDGWKKKIDKIIANAMKGCFDVI